MNKPRSSATLVLVALVLLLLLVAYVGSYLVLVTPGNYVTATITNGGGVFYFQQSYRWNEQALEWFFWPLEQVDRKLRPGEWDMETKIKKGMAASCDSPRFPSSNRLSLAVPVASCPGLRLLR